MKTTTLPLKHSTNRLPCRFALLIPLALACFAVSPQARAVCQEGCDTALNNTFLGDMALVADTTGGGNTALGAFTLVNNSTGCDNTACGVSALNANSTGSFNTASGALALFFNTTGSDNVADGGNALFVNTMGNNNTASGFDALSSNTTGTDNVANGYKALQSNTTGVFDTATGMETLFGNTTRNSNTASGVEALSKNTTGNNNIAVGFQAGINLTTGSNNIDVGNNGVAGESKTIRIGTGATQRRTFIAGISGTTVPGGIGVIVGSNGQLGTVVSSERFKDEIKPMDETSEAILALKPVTFRYKHELDPKGLPQFGLVAEEVEKVNPDLVARDEDGKPYTVRYDAVNAMLLNEFLKEHRKVEEQETTIAQLKSVVAKHETTGARQQKQIEALTTGLQKVNAELELSKTAPKTVSNNH
jgi:uncharacterized coiled-coil protein SlyX